MQVIRGAVDNDEKAVLEHSRKLQFLTGYESKVQSYIIRDEATVGSGGRQSPPDFGGPPLSKNVSAGARHSRVQGYTILFVKKIC